MTLYDIIADLRREKADQATSKTLDLVMIELGHTRDNLRSALSNIKGEALPPGGGEVLKELEARAHQNRLDNLSYPAVEMKGFRPPLEAVDEGTAGVAALLGITSVALLGLAALAVVAGLNGIFHWF